jgi:hypothetical protein
MHMSMAVHDGQIEHLISIAASSSEVPQMHRQKYLCTTSTEVQCVHTHAAYSWTEFNLRGQSSEYIRRLGTDIAVLKPAKFFSMDSELQMRTYLYLFLHRKQQLNS